jgi:hypothetical protein
MAVKVTTLFAVGGLFIIKEIIALLVSTFAIVESGFNSFDSENAIISLLTNFSRY